MLKARFALFLSPLVLYLLCLLIPFVKGKRPSRFAVTAGLSLLLLLYFLVVAGTGIFWVAAQELPVFDWHYLPGYILLAVGLTHTALHWKTLLLLFRKGAPAFMVVPEGGRFKGWLRVAGYGLLFAAAGCAVFLLGMRQGTQRVVLEMASSGAGSASAGREPLAKPLIPPTLVHTGGATMTLAELYHEGSSYPARAALPGLTIATRPALYKDYAGSAKVQLPAVRSEGGGSILDAYRAWISGKAAATPPELNLAGLASLLYHTQGVSKTLQFGARTFDLRTAPSAGALYPVNVYVLAQKVQGLAPGLYYYHPKDSALLLVKADPALPFRLAMASGSPELHEQAAATVIFTSTFGRTAFKYRERAYRYVAMDTGHAAYNLGLCAASLGLRAPMIARFDDQALNTLLGLDPEQEAALLLMPLGSPKAVSYEPIFQKEAANRAEASRSSFVGLVHGGTSLRLAGGRGELPRHPAPVAGGAGAIALPAPVPGKPLLPSIRVRRSVREFANVSMSMEEFSALCAAASGVDGKLPVPDPLLSASAPLAFYAVVRDVKGLKPGVYRYIPVGHALQLVKEGDFSKACMEACLQQEFCGTANVVFIKTAKWKELLYPDGDRGYRYANLRAGVMGEGLYLQGTALGIGVCGVGAFQDPDVAALLGLDLKEEVPFYVTAAGKAKEGQ